jgi:hypothetical protein
VERWERSRMAGSMARWRRRQRVHEREMRTGRRTAAAAVDAAGATRDGDRGKRERLGGSGEIRAADKEGSLRKKRIEDERSCCSGGPRTSQRDGVIAGRKTPAPGAVVRSNKGRMGRKGEGRDGKGSMHMRPDPSRPRAVLRRPRLPLRRPILVDPDASAPLLSCFDRPLG